MMNKEMWVRPVTEVQTFEANEYVAACGDENRVYKFTCDATGGPLYAKDTDGLGYDGASYKPCSKTHEAPVSDVFVNGYIDYNGSGEQELGEAVIVWLEYSYRYVPFVGYQKYVSNGHATTNLVMNSWETAKS